MRILEKRIPLDVALVLGHILIVLGYTACRALFDGGLQGEPLTLAGGVLFQLGFAVFFLLGPRRLHLRVIAQVVYYSTAYGVLAAFVPCLGLDDHGGLLREIDEALFGCQPAEELHLVFPPFLHEIFAVGYSLFLPYLYFNAARCILRDDPPNVKRFLVGYAAIYAIGYLGYVFLPSSGPRFFDDQYAGGQAFLAIKEGLFLSRHLTSFMDEYSGHQNVFPSLHAAVSLFMLLFEFLYRSRIIALLSLPVVLGIWIGTVYHGYHYLVDLLGAVVLVAIGLVLAARSVRNKAPASTPLPPR